MSIEEFGYTQELKRALTFKDLVIYGLVWMIPVAPFGIYGFVADAANGMVALAYVVGMIAMFFTAMSYKAMSADFPLAGSVYTYAQRGIGETVGFLSGWLILLDYILIPSLLYIASAAALAPMFPEVPKWLWIVAFTFIGAGVNLCGVEITARASKLMLYAQLVVVAIFCVVGLRALYVEGLGAGQLTLAPLYQPHKFNIGMIFAAVSVASLSFLGFDAISTMSEEVAEGKRDSVGRATLASLFLAGALFILQTWIAADLSTTLKFKSLDTAFYETAQYAGGTWLNRLTSWSTVIAWGIANSLVSTASIARILYSMARDRKLPMALAKVSAKSKSPYVAIILVAFVSLIVSIVFMNKLDTITSFVNFGALTGFLVLHISVINHFVLRNKSKKYVEHLLIPAVGFCILAYVLYSMGRDTWILGTVWLALGIAYYATLTKVLRRSAQLQV